MLPPFNPWLTSLVAADVVAASSAGDDALARFWRLPRRHRRCTASCSPVAIRRRWNSRICRSFGSRS